MELAKPGIVNYIIDWEVINLTMMLGSQAGHIVFRKSEVGCASERVWNWK